MTKNESGECAMQTQYVAVKIPWLFLALMVFYAKPTEAKVSERLFEADIPACIEKLEKRSYSDYECSLPLPGMENGQYAVKAEEFRRTAYPCAIEVYVDTTVYRVQVRKLDDPKHLGFNRSDAVACLKSLYARSRNDLRIRLLVVE
jgi:hypothetical protein